MYRLMLWIGCAVWITPAMASESGVVSETRVARYTTVALVPTSVETHPLETIVTLAFPRGAVKTVGEAIHHLLSRTGYRFGQVDTAVQEILALPLPEVHRRLGPCSVRTVLQTLMGDSYALATDPARRVVGFALTPQAKQAATLTSSAAKARVESKATVMLRDLQSAEQRPQMASWSQSLPSSSDADIEVIVVPLKN